MMDTLDYRVATVMDVLEDTLSMADHNTGTTFSIPRSAPGGVGASPGDQWLLTRALGTWALDRLLMKAVRNARPDRTFAEVMRSLEERQLVQTSFSDTSTPEALHLAYIGEVRFIAYAPDPYWWPEADGSAVQRLKYRELGSVLSPGTTTTFLLPVVPVLGPVRPYVCAR